MDPVDTCISVVRQALQLKSLSFLGVLHVPVEESDCHHVPLSLGDVAACGQKLDMSPQVLLGKSSWGLWAGLFPAGAVCGRHSASWAVMVNADGGPRHPPHLCAVLESLGTKL